MAQRLVGMQTSFESFVKGEEQPWSDCGGLSDTSNAYIVLSHPRLLQAATTLNPFLLGFIVGLTKLN